MCKKKILPCIFIFSALLLAGTQQQKHVHQYIVCQAWECAKFQCPDLINTGMADHIGTSEKGDDNAPWSNGLVVTGAYREDCEYPVYLYGGINPSGINLAHVTMSHFWDARECYAFTEISKISSVDSTQNRVIKPRLNYLHLGKIKSEYKYYGKQFVFGELIGIGLSIPGGLLGKAITPKDIGIGGIAYGLSGMYVGYTLGVSLGVSMITSKSSSFIKTYPYSILGSIIGGCIGSYIFFGQGQKGIGCCALIFGPPLSSIIFSEIFIRQKTANKSNSKLSVGDIGIYFDIEKHPILKMNIIQYNF